MALHRVRHRHRLRATRVSRRPTPRARPGRRPHPLRERHRPEPLPQPHVHDQLRLARRGHARGRSDRLDPAPAPTRPTRESRAEDAALPAVARRCAAHPRTTPVLAAYPTHLALGPRACCCVHPARGAARPDRSTIQPDTTSDGSNRQNSTPATSPCPPTRRNPTKIKSPPPRSVSCSVNHRGYRHIGGELLAFEFLD